MAIDGLDNSENVVKLHPRSHKEVFTFADGATVTIETPENGPPLNVAQTVYMLSNIQHQIHRMMEP